MIITTCELSDLGGILEIYNQAIAFQKTKNCAVWPVFSDQDITLAINEKRQFKIVINNQIACVWTYTFQDKSIWGHRDQNDAVYIHKIATNFDFKGRNLVNEIVNFSKNYAILKNKSFLRMDTVGKNIGLISYYTKCGFDYLGLFKLAVFNDLPAHYFNAEVSLFEMRIAVG